jgi:hypothetical protein
MEILMAVELGSLSEGDILYYLTPYKKPRQRIIERYIVKDIEDNIVSLECLNEENSFLLIHEDDQELFGHSLFYELEEIAEAFPSGFSEEICFCCKGLLEPFWNEHND